MIVAAFLVSWPAARASDHFGRRPFILLGGLMGAAGVLILVFSHYQLLPSEILDPLARTLKVPPLAAQATLVGVFIGIGYGVFFSVDWAFIQDVIPSEEAGLFMGFSNIATAGSGVIARFDRRLPARPVQPRARTFSACREAFRSSLRYSARRCWSARY